MRARGARGPVLQGRDLSGLTFTTSNTADVWTCAACARPDKAITARQDTAAASVQKPDRWPCATGRNGDKAVSVCDSAVKSPLTWANCLNAREPGYNCYSSLV
jgi:hypothetical protein